MIVKIVTNTINGIVIIVIDNVGIVMNIREGLIFDLRDVEICFVRNTGAHCLLSKLPLQMQGDSNEGGHEQSHLNSRAART